MVDPVEDLEDLPPELDPVVRMPKRMAPLTPEPEPLGPGAKLILAVGLAGALVGGALGAVGLGIVYATLGPAREERAPAVASAARGASRAAREAPAEPVGTTGDGGRAGALDPGVESPAPRPVYTTTQARLGRGRTLASVLASLRLTRGEGARVTRALRAVLDLRALQPGDVVAAMRDPARRELARVEYRRTATLVFAVARDAEGRWRAERVELTHTTERVVSGFRVERTVEEAVREGGFHPEVLDRLAEVLPLVDAPARLQPGDEVRLVVEEERLGGEFFRYGRVEGIDYRGVAGTRRAFWLPLGRGGDLFDREGLTWERGELRSPAPEGRISSRFDLRRLHPVLRVVRPHLGVDFAAPEGSPVQASAAGVVLFVGFAGASGNLVRLSHPALSLETGYAHLARFAHGLRSGQRVTAGQLVGYVGSTGRSTGPHLHFAVKRRGRFLDPLTLYTGRRRVPDAQRATFEALTVRVGAELDRVVVGGRSLEGAGNPRSPEAHPQEPQHPPPEALPPDGVEAPEEPPLEEEGPS